MSDYRMSNTNKTLKRISEVMTVGNKSKRRRLVRKQREDEGNTFSLPEEILFKILLRLPAKHLHEVVRYVCKQAFDIVTNPVFVRMHRQMSSSGFLIQNFNEDYTMSYIEEDTTKLKLTEIKIPFPTNKRRRLIRKEREDEGNTFCLPEEMFFNILLFIPAKHLHEVVKCVCKQSFDIVTDPVFVRMHRQMSSSGFLIQNPNEDSKMSYIEADITRFKVTEIEIPFPAKIMGSFNGLVLLHDLTNLDIFHVMNPVTKVNFTLPPLKRLCDINSQAGFGVTSSGLYKVVHAKASSTRPQMSVFTLGVDRRWRFIDLQGISVGVNLKYALMNIPRFIAGFIYWYSNVGFNGVALDVDTEIIYQFSAPKGSIRGEGDSNYFLSTETSLGLIKITGDVWRFWRLTGVKTGEWSEVAGINLQPVLSKVVKTFYPSKLWGVWPVRLINGVFWFYRRVDDENDVVVRYDLVSKSVSFFPIMRLQSTSLIHPHVHTLLSPGNRKLIN